MRLLKSHILITDYIRSVGLMGGRDFIVFAAVATLENHIGKSLYSGPLDQRLATSSALVTPGASSHEGSDGGVADKNASGPRFRLVNYLHAICRFLGHGF